MKYIFLNLKRFDIPKEFGGVNSIAAPENWADYIAASIGSKLEQYNGRAEFAIFFPEAHIIPAAKSCNGSWKLGCQGVYRDDVSVGGNFGAYTTERPAKSMAALGCKWTIIGHCEERKNLGEIVAAANGDKALVNEILNKEVIKAQEAGLNVLYCVGEKAEEMDNRIEVITGQLSDGLKNADLAKVVIGYEPLWAIGPGRPVPTTDEIEKVAQLCKSVVNCPVVYGGGLKEENAEMIAAAKSMDGGLIALTRFSGDIGFYPDEYLRIIEKYLNAD